jgi:hypothetical protein
MVRSKQEPKMDSCSRRTPSIGVGMYDEQTLVHEGGRVAISNKDLNYPDRKWIDIQFGSQITLGHNHTYCKKLNHLD